MISDARNGGSMTSQYAKLLKQHVQSGKVSLHTHTTVQRKSFNAQSQTYLIETDPPIESLPELDFIIYATGTAADISNVDFLQSLRRNFEMHQVGGLPKLTEALAFSPDLPCFVTGRLAGLELGPGAGNLEGAREGAERVAWGIQNWLGVDSDHSQHQAWDEYNSDNRYSCLDAEG